MLVCKALTLDVSSCSGDLSGHRDSRKPCKTFWLAAGMQPYLNIIDKFMMSWISLCWMEEKSPEVWSSYGRAVFSFVTVFGIYLIGDIYMTAGGLVVRLPSTVMSIVTPRMGPRQDLIQ